ncbi:MAG: hypothetical protein FD119_1908, partial [Stygiobacter sp.]
RANRANVPLNAPTTRSHQKADARHYEAPACLCALQAQIHARVGARTISALWEAVGSICDLYTADECWNYLKHAGYVSD